MTDHEFIDDDKGLAQLVETLISEPEYALDTEFHRERTYYPKVALLQLAWPGGIALVDPLAVDLRPLAAVLDGKGLAVVHAAQQDLEVLQRSCGTVPARLFDTQLAAGFLGQATPSLTNLVASELGHHLPKGDRLTDWLRRPLTADQRSYAASDVEYLLLLRRLLTERLDAKGRVSWALEECELLRVRGLGGNDPNDAWLRIKDVRTLRGKARGVARAVAAWRERKAMAIDQPVRFVLPDLAILGVAQRAPTSFEELRATRGIEERHARGDIGNELLAAVSEGVESEIDLPRNDGDDLEKSLRPAVTLVSAWVSQLARDQKIDTALLATRTDLVELLARNPDARLLAGWRAEMVGDGIRSLVEGRAALAFDGVGNLKLINI